MRHHTQNEMLRYAFALLLAVRCQNKTACKQLLARFYHEVDEKQLHTMMNRTIYLLTAKERDWLSRIV